MPDLCGTTSLFALLQTTATSVATQRCRCRRLMCRQVLILFQCGWVVGMDEAASPSSGAVSGADRWSAPDLGGSQAVVTGANRGAGRGIARVLGQCGATVYVTGRSRSGLNATTAGEDVSVSETARRVSELGGTAIAVEVDHSVDAEVEVLFTKIQHEQGKLDILVNNAWGGYSVDDGTLDEPFWRQPMLRFDRM